MPRLAHGAVITPKQVRDAQRELASSADIELAFEVAGPEGLQAFDFLFKDLQNNETNLLPQSPNTVKQLKALGQTMEDPGVGAGGDPGDADIPAIYTYFGQFVDHDITLEETSFTREKLVAANMVPLTVAKIRRDMKNHRRPTLELDSVYGPVSPPNQAAPRDGNKMLIGWVTRIEGVREKPVLRVRLKGDDNDLPRERRSPGKTHDRAARIGDGRNDENLIIAQLHLAFLKAHNAWVSRGKTFAQARRLLRQHYQHIVIHDFLERVADPAIVRRIREHGNQVYDAAAEPFFMPLEFTVAAYRFGHSMVRGDYDFNLNFNRKDQFSATLDDLFTFTALSGQLGDFNTLPDFWIIEWHRFVDIPDIKAKNKARRVDTELAQGLFQLLDLDGRVLADDIGRLAVRNLLRGYGLRMPTGQAVASTLHLPALTARQIEEAAASPAQVQALRKGGFLERTPLWYYLLAEAKHPSGGKGQRLGPVGSTIVAEVLIGLVRRSEDSILSVPNWRPSLPTAHSGRFELADLLRFAGVLPQTYKVRRGDTLSEIAKKQLRAVRRWPEIFVLNRDDISHRDRIRVGQVFLLPGDTPRELRPLLYKVRRADTLFELAKKHLGDGQRWREIHALNRDVIGPNPNQIRPGQELVILPP
jgi:nucleoid-associated protein YgaU